ncbi:alcohol dehydrogenase catalytic domain-containing protein [Actinomadura yumaensis]|uniref:alcohol dehydrogenase catalytic domain-containing protein n=1 Tax=Actinomadura yumaensis TaxID=111807 RepID=UPI0036228AC7
MRAVRFHQYGPPEVLRYEEVPDPVPGDGEVVVEVAAAGIGYTDVQLRAGALGDWMPDLPMPFAPGHEVVGTAGGAASSRRSWAAATPNASRRPRRRWCRSPTGSATTRPSRC